MSYRRGFPVLEGTHTTSDNGWGCMLRSGQMLLAQTLVRHCLGTAWLRGRPAAAQRDGSTSETGDAADLVAAQPAAFQATLRRIAGLFVDHPQCPFSVHSIAARGAAHGVRVGAWFAPTPVCLALRDLVARTAPAGLACVVARDATVRLDEVRGAFRTAPAAPPHYFCAALRPAGAPDAPAGAPADAATSTTTANAPHGLLLAVPLRLGVAAVEPAYYAPLAGVFRWPQCVGIVGGEPHSSLYFFAAQDAHLYFLNPHVVQRALAPPVPADALDLASYRATTVRRAHCSTLDPSLALGLYFRDEPDFDAFLAAFRAGTHGTSTLFSVVDSVQPLSSTTVHDDDLDSWEIVSDT